MKDFQFQKRMRGYQEGKTLTHLMHSFCVTYPTTVGKIGEKAVCGSVFSTIWHCILSAINKNVLLQTVSLPILLTETRLDNPVFHLSHSQAEY